MHPLARALVRLVLACGATLTCLAIAPASARESMLLTLDANGVPQGVWGLGSNALAMAAARDPKAYLYQIRVNPHSSNPMMPMASVSYFFYLPRLHQHVDVTYVNLQWKPAPEQTESLRKAGQLQAVQEQMADAMLPKLTELPDRAAGAIPLPLPRANLDVPAALAVALRAGLRRFEGADLQVSDKDPRAPYVVWAFEGHFPQQDSQRRLYVDALTGNTLPEKALFASTLADDYQRIQQHLVALRALLQQQAAARKDNTAQCRLCIDSHGACMVNSTTARGNEQYIIRTGCDMAQFSCQVGAGC